MEGASTASLRKMAPHWSLAGDKQLLDLLQNLHESIVSKCQAANTSLDEMVNALDTASISLQNVNNRFMALSNSQFVESRVYDDDVEIVAQEVPVKEPPKPVDHASELNNLKESFRILESYHEEVHILDSDSETSDEEEDRMVYKPKDQYADRPLPYIIGSRQWKSKWHAGLLPESDTDSSTSKPGAPLNEYSDSEPEENDLNIDKPQVSQRTISTNSSIGSELTIPTVGKPADIAAELARRLGGNVPPPVPQPEPEIQSPTSAGPTKFYRPQQPTTATIFSDEPPPLDHYESDHSYQSESDDDDIFAELHRKGGRQTEPRASNSVVDELFGNVANVDRNRGGFRDEDVFSGVSQPVPPAKQSSSLFEDRQDSELFINKPREEPQPTYVEKQSDTSVKKPIGGISLFGNNKGTESIGAAILKRNQRKASTSEEETENESPQTKTSSIIKDKPKDAIDSFDPKDKTQKDIINDLFTKPNNKVEKVAAVKSEKSGSQKVESTTKKVDLFADDLFDDIDDIFTSTTKAPSKESKGTVPKSLFDDDEDEDDLFANVAVSRKTVDSKQDKKNKGIFDSDDDLFSESNEESDINKVVNIDNAVKTPIDSKLFYDRKDIVSKTYVDADNKELFSDKKGSASNVVTKSVEVIKVADKTKNIQEVFNDNIIRKTDNFKAEQEKNSISSNQVKGIFDSDSDDGIFSDFRTKSRVSNNQNKANIENKEVENKKTEMTNIDDFEDVDSLFLRKEIHATDKNTSISPQIKNNEITGSEVNKFLDDNDDSLFLQKGKNITNPNIKSSDKDDRKNVAIDDVENDLCEKEKTDEIVNESIEDTPKNKKNTIVYCEDELFSSKQNEKTEREDGISSIFTKTYVPNTQFKSPSLFDDDDNGDMDNLFSKTTIDDRFKEVSSKTDSTVPDTLIEKDSNEHIFEVPKTKASIDTEFIVASAHKSETKIHKTEAKIDIETMNKPIIDNATNVNDISQNINVSQIIQPDINDIPKNEIKVIDDIYEESEKNIKESEKITAVTEDLQQEANIKPIENSELTIPDVDFKYDSNGMPEESLHKQKSENNTDYDNITEFIEKEPLVSEPKSSVTNEPDIFSDIFSDVPPDFERPKEPKKSKNINALFDDDSDDEALFFKKNDIIIEEKLDMNFGTQEDRLFHIFHDEPPAVDVDFTQKPQKVASTDVENTMLIDSEKPFESIVTANSGSEQLNSKTIYTDKLKKEPNLTIDSEQKTITDEIKKPVGKLKPMNLNINVNSLLPGASPKKTKSVEQIDGQTVSINSPDADNKDAEAKMIKSVSFEGDPDSEILDNKISKERAKIQVKRRPSTRRARKEAVRKSGIDFGDDSTDNSSSTDISKKDDLPIDKNDFTNTVNNEEVHYTQENYNTNVNKNVKKSHEDKSEHKEIQDEGIFRSNQEIQSISIETVDQSSKTMKEQDKKTHIGDFENENIPSTVKTSNENSSVSKYNTRSNVKSKVVYILNDEDIFTDTKPIENPTKSKILNIIDDDDALFKSSSNNESTIATLGNVYKDVKSNRKDLDNFDSDEDIFKASEPKPTNNTEEKIKNKSEIDEMEAKIDKLFVKTQNSKPKSSLFDLSDDENDLFGSRKSTEKSEVLTAGTSDKVKDVKLPKVEVKGSLFGDDSDDDDLFGVKTTNKKQEPSRLLSKPKEVVSKASEPVFEDPLSLLGQEDDL